MDPRQHSASMANATDMFHQDDRKRVRDLWDTGITSGEPFEFSARMAHTDESIIKCHGQGQIVRDENDISTHMFGAFSVA